MSLFAAPRYWSLLTYSDLYVIGGTFHIRPETSVNLHCEPDQWEQHYIVQAKEQQKSSHSMWQDKEGKPKSANQITNQQTTGDVKQETLHNCTRVKYSAILGPRAFHKLAGLSLSINIRKELM